MQKQLVLEKLVWISRKLKTNGIFSIMPISYKMHETDIEYAIFEQSSEKTVIDLGSEEFHRKISMIV